MPLLCILASQIGSCVIKENIMNNRFCFIKEINKINNSFNIINNIIHIKKINYNININNINNICLTDLRGGAAIILSICIYLKKNKSKKKIIINNYNFIKRGYPDIEKFFNIYNININYINENSSLLFLKPINLHSVIGL